MAERSDFEDEEMYDTKDEEGRGCDEPEIHILEGQIKIVDHDKDDDLSEVEECEEPGCIKNAVRRWNGRKVCNGHYNLFKAKEESLYGKGVYAMKKDDEFEFH